MVSSLLVGSDIGFIFAKTLRGREHKRLWFKSAFRILT